MTTIYWTTEEFLGPDEARRRKPRVGYNPNNPVRDFVKFLRSKAIGKNRIRLSTGYLPRKLWAKDSHGNEWHFDYDQCHKVKELLKDNPNFDIRF